MEAAIDAETDFVAISGIEAPSRRSFLAGVNEEESEAIDSSDTQIRNSVEPSDFSLFDDKVKKDPAEKLGSKTVPVIQFSMTCLLCVFVVAMLLSIAVAPKYRLLLITFWIVIGGFFTGLIALMQSEISQKRARAVYPYLQVVASNVAKEMSAFQQDWREQVLMISNDPHNEVSAETTDQNTGILESDLQRAPSKARSKIFKLMVAPFVPIIRRRKRRKGSDDQRPANEETSSQYVPPREMELV